MNRTSESTIASICTTLAVKYSKAMIVVDLLHGCQVEPTTTLGREAAADTSSVNIFRFVSFHCASAWENPASWCAEGQEAGAQHSRRLLVNCESTLHCTTHMLLLDVSEWHETWWNLKTGYLYLFCQGWYVHIFTSVVLVHCVNAVLYLLCANCKVLEFVFFFFSINVYSHVWKKIRS